MNETTPAPVASAPVDAEDAFLEQMATFVPSLDDAPPAKQAESAEENQPEETEGEELEETEEAEAEEPKEPKAEESEDPLIEFTVDGEKMRIPLTELQKGYSRQADYSRKTNEIAAERQRLESEREQYARNLQALTQQAEALLAEREKAIDWEWLKANDPATYAIQKLDMKERQEALQIAQHQQQWAEQAIMAHQGKRVSEYVAAQRQKLAEKIPEYADPKKGEAFVSDMRGYLQNEGFSDEEIGTLVDHRMVLLVNKARQFDKLQSSKAVAEKKVTEAPKFIKPGQARVNQGAKRTADILKELKRSGSDEAAHAFFRTINPQ